MKHKVTMHISKEITKITLSSIPTRSMNTVVLLSDEVPDLCEISHIDYDDDISHLSQEEIGCNSSMEDVSMKIVEDKSARNLLTQKCLSEGYQDLISKSKLESWDECFCNIQECRYWYNKETLESTWLNPFQDNDSMTSNKYQEETCHNAEIRDFTPRKNRNSGLETNCQHHHIKNESKELQPAVSNTNNQDEDMESMWRLLAQRRKERVLEKQYSYQNGSRLVKRNQLKHRFIVIMIVAIVTVFLLYAMGMRNLGSPALSTVTNSQNMMNRNERNIDIGVHFECFNDATVYPNRMDREKLKLCITY